MAIALGIFLVLIVILFLGFIGYDLFRSVPVPREITGSSSFEHKAIPRFDKRYAEPAKKQVAQARSIPAKGLLTLDDLEKLYASTDMQFNHLSTATREFHAQRILAPLQALKLSPDEERLFEGYLESNTVRMDLIEVVADRMTFKDIQLIVDTNCCCLMDLYSGHRGIGEFLDKISCAYVELLIQRGRYREASYWCQVGRLGWEREVYYLRQGGAGGRSVLARRSAQRLFKALRDSVLTLGPNFQPPQMRPEY